MKRVGLEIFLAVASTMVFSGRSNANEQKPSDNRLLAWTIQIARHVKEPPGWTEYEHRKIDDLAFSPDDQRLIVCCQRVENFSPKVATALWNSIVCHSE
jgi:hypothetical protein